MLAMLNEYLPVLIYILLCILIVLLIVISIKVIRAMNKVELIVNDVNEKVQSLNGIFSIIDSVTDKLSALTEIVSDSIIIFVKSIFNKRKKKIESEEKSDE